MKSEFGNYNNINNEKMSNMNSQKIKEFLNHWDDVIHHNDLKRMEEIEASLKRAEKNPYKTFKYGTHRSSSPWSNDETREGPDTCACFSEQRQITEADSIMNYYDKLALRFMK